MYLLSNSATSLFGCYCHVLLLTMMLLSLLSLLLLQMGSSDAFSPETMIRNHQQHWDDSCHRPCHNKLVSPLYSSSSSARDLLYQDQQNAMERRALFEEEILSNSNKMEELKAPTIKIPAQKAGTGFATKGTSPLQRLAVAQAKVVRKEGVLRINNALSPESSDKLREYVLEQQQIAAERTETGASVSKAFYGVENQRKGRCDLQLSLLKGGYAADRGGDIGGSATTSTTHQLADALQ